MKVNATDQYKKRSTDSTNVETSFWERNFRVSIEIRNIEEKLFFIDQNSKQNFIKKKFQVF